MEVRETLDNCRVRWEDDFPVPRTQYAKLYLDASDHRLRVHNTSAESKASYESSDGRATFDLTFEQDTELAGYTSLKLWVSSEGDDMDLFATVRKLDRNGNEVFFDSSIAPENGQSHLAGCGFPIENSMKKSRLHGSLT